MSYSKEDWNEDFKKLKILFKKESTFEEAMELFIYLHAMVHSSKVSDLKISTLEDVLWHDISDEAFRSSVNKKGRTVAYGIWHSTRIEDITMNLLVSNQDEVMSEGSWKEKIHSSIYSTGNEMTSEEILEFSKHINFQALIDYRNQVAIRTKEIVSNIDYNKLKSAICKEGLDKALAIGAVSTHEEAIWLINYWKNKTVAGILLMPATRHNLVHINESLEAKKKGGRIK